MSVSFLFYHKEAVIQIWQCGSVPTLYVESGSDLLPYVHESKENRVDVRTTFYDTAGNVMLDGTAEMYGRGNTTWWMGDKRPYNLKFSDPISVGPFDQVWKLNLLAEYNDRSKMHNALVYHAGQVQEIPYASGYMYFDLYINGAYSGLYGATTKDNYRKNLEQDQIKGIFTITSGDVHTGVVPKLWRNPVRILYGDQAQILETISLVEADLEARNWDGCRQRMDMESVAAKYLLDEVFANTDVGYASQYFYIDRNDVIHSMLPWDYDHSMGNSFFIFNNKVGCELKAFLDAPNWYSVLLESPEFREICLKLLEKQYSEEFLAYLNGYLQKIAQDIESSWNCDQIRWGTKYLAGDPDDLKVGDYPALLMGILHERKQFLTKVFREWEDYCIVSFYALGDWNANFCVPRGSELAPYLEDAVILHRSSEERAWRTEAGLAPEEIDTVTEDIRFRLHKLEEMEKEGG